MYDRHSTLTFWAKQIGFYIFQILSAESRENERQYDDGGEPQHGWWHYKGRHVQDGSGREEQLHGEQLPGQLRRHLKRGGGRGQYHVNLFSST